MSNSVTIQIPNNSRAYVNGYTNSASWLQQITVAPSCQATTVWTGSGPQDNKAVGQLSISAGTNKTVTISMQFNPGSGYQPSSVEATPFNMPGLAGFIVGGQDSGGRPNGPAYWNTVAFVYWAVGY